jgi:hypothetical protein
MGWQVNACYVRRARLCTGWQDEHRARIEGFPAETRDAHAHSSNHRAEIEASAACGCFYCCAQFSPAAIVEWVDDDANGRGKTAVCPRCGIDSVIGDASGFAVSPKVLIEMRSYWF